MTKQERDDGAPRGRRSKPTRKQIQAGKDNLAKGRAARQRRREEAEREGRDTASERWAKLVDGTLTVKDLDDEELKAMRVRGKDGVINKGRAIMPSHLAMAMRTEYIGRCMAKMEDALPEMIAALVEIATDGDEPAAARVKAANIVMERVIGRAPIDVKVTADKFDEVAETVVGVVVDREDLSA